jgi:hypothetical protein
MAPSYLFDNARPQAGQGFSSIEARLYGLLCGEGLLDVAAGGYLAISPGGSPGAAQRLTRYEQIGEEMVASGRITTAELERACELLRHPACPVLTPGTLISARGRRPG